jgi:hypothetical protein
VSIGLALVGALLFAVSAALQQRAARALAWSARWRDPWWRLGWLVNVTGFGAQAVALHLGSIAVVQALLVTQLLFALPLGTAALGRRPLPRDWWATASVCAGLVVLLVARGTVPQTGGRRPLAWVVVLGAAVLITVLVLVARLPRVPLKAAAMGTAAGICFCLTAVFLVFVGRGALGWLAGLCVSTVVGLVLVQEAFARGSLPTALTAMTVTDPVASWLAGALLFDTRPVPGLRTLLGYLLAIGFIGLGVAVLAHSPTLRSRPAVPRPSAPRDTVAPPPAPRIAVAPRE